MRRYGVYVEEIAKNVPNYMGTGKHTEYVNGYLEDDTIYSPKSDKRNAKTWASYNRAYKVMKKYIQRCREHNVYDEIVKIEVQPLECEEINEYGHKWYEVVTA